MDIYNKLKLSQQPVKLFLEGGFLKSYNHSFFIVKTHFNINLKPIIKHIQSINETVVYGGFPVDTIYKRFPQAIKTPYGYQLPDNQWDLSEYERWFNKLVHPKRPEFTAAQQQFLSTWHPDKYTRSEEHAFLQALKDYLA